MSAISTHLPAKLTRMSQDFVMVIFYRDGYKSEPTTNNFRVGKIQSLKKIEDLYLAKFKTT